MSDKRIILLGPPGAGKGTQATKLCAALHIRRLATGDLLREAIAKNTPVGKLAKPFMEAGLFVPDDVVIKLIEEVLNGFRRDAAGDADVAFGGGGGYVLDGFPRRVPQAQALDELLRKRGERIDKAILINTPDDFIVKRLEQRRSCPDPLCGLVYNLLTKPPFKPGKCDRCGKDLIMREDDKPETIRKLQKIYCEETQPLIKYLKDKGLLSEVDGSKSMDEVAVEVMKAAMEEPTRKSQRRKRVESGSWSV